MTKIVDEKDELYPALGKFIVSFTEIEHWLTAILEVLTDAESNMWLTLFFIDGLLTGRVRDTIHKVANLRLEGNEPLRDKLKATLKEVAELTDKRNDLVHGQWVFNSTITKVHNYGLKKVDVGKGRHFWQHLEDKAVFARDLTKFTKTADRLAVDLKDLRKSIEDYLSGAEQPA
jgi:hypothetical protein